MSLLRSVVICGFVNIVSPSYRIAEENRFELSVVE